MAKAKLIQARVLTAIVVGSLALLADDVLEADEKLIKSLKEQGSVDDHKDAVSYSINTLGKEVIAYTGEEQQAAILEERLA